MPDVRAVLLDAMGTLVGLEPPAPLLRRELARRGVAVSLDAAQTAIRAEIAFYRREHDRAVDAAALAALRDDCAAVLDAALPPDARGLPDLRDALLSSLRFFAFDDVVPTLAAWRERGVALVVCSNWDVSLHGVLRDTGLDGLLDAVVTSAEVGAAKPRPEIFAAALRAAGGVAPDRALHVGDDPQADRAGARAAGLRAVLLDREGAGTGSDVVSSLAEVLALTPTCGSRR